MMLLNSSNILYYVFKSLINAFKLFAQTVELRVSIHCKGCEGKLRKHISRMEGKYITISLYLYFCGQ